MYYKYKQICMFIWVHLYLFVIIINIYSFIKVYTCINVVISWLQDCVFTHKYYHFGTKCIKSSQKHLTNFTKVLPESERNEKYHNALQHKQPIRTVYINSFRVFVLLNYTWRLIKVNV